MRLGQLARKLALRPEQIVEFLATKNIQIENGSNTRLEDSYVELVVEKFDPNGIAITPQELTSKEEDVPATTSIEPIAAQEAEKIEETSLVIENSISEISKDEEKAEVIKAPKVELSGLKVLGKIELPEPKKKEQPSTELQPGAEIDKDTKPKERTRPIQNRSAKSNPRPIKNSIALQREREEAEAQKRREAAKALEKEKRAQHYFNKVKVVTPMKTSKYDQIVEEVSESVPQPKTLLGKFFRWFTT